MPGYPWLTKTPVPTDDIDARMRALRRVGVPYTDAEIADAPKLLAGKNEAEALIAYLQSLGGALKAR